MTSPPETPGRRGRWIVIALLLIGLIAATTSILYWRSVSRSETAGADASGSPAPFDVARAQRELDDLQHQANEAIAHQDVTSVLPAAQHLVDEYPRFAGAHTLLAQLLLEKGRGKESLDQLELSLKYNAQAPEVEKLAGAIALSLGFPEKAIHHFSMAVGLDPASPQYRVFLAQAYKQSQDFDKARFTLLEALKIDSHLHEAYFLLSSLDAREGNLDQAITQNKRAIAEVPPDDSDNKVAYVQNLAKLLQRANRPEEALQALQGLDVNERLKLPVLNDMAICWTMMGQPKKGAELFEQAMGLRPGEWRLPADAAIWYLRAGDKPDAQRMTDLVRRLNADAPVLKDLDAQLAK